MRISFIFKAVSLFLYTALQSAKRSEFADVFYGPHLKTWRARKWIRSVNVSSIHWRIKHAHEHHSMLYLLSSSVRTMISSLDFPIPFRVTPATLILYGVYLSRLVWCKDILLAFTQAPSMAKVFFSLELYARRMVTSYANVVSYASSQGAKSHVIRRLVELVLWALRLAGGWLTEGIIVVVSREF